MGDWLRRNEVAIGDVRELAGRLEPQSIQCLITSPPYFGLRSYLDSGHADKGKELGSEATPSEFVANLVAVFAALRGALKDDGCLWLNLGDAYAVNGGGRSYGTTDGAVGRAEAPGGQRKAPDGYPAKCLLGMPWRVAFALIDDGWILRSEIIWSKPSCMPESVTDRVTRSHEQIFLFAKRPTYFYDAEAIKEKAAWTRENNPDWQHQRAATNAKKGAGNTNAQSGGFTGWSTEQGRNKRSVWTVTPGNFPDSHYATFPPNLVRPCILAGTSAAGECSACGKAWIRLVERESIERGVPRTPTGRPDKPYGTVPGSNTRGVPYRAVTDERWAPQCHCEAPTRPQVVLDPFAGSCTTWQVAHELGRDFVGIDLDERAAKWGADRLAKLPVGMLPGLATA